MKTTSKKFRNLRPYLENVYENNFMCSITKKNKNKKIKIKNRKTYLATRKQKTHYF